jgi:hypothetical protein
MRAGAVALAVRWGHRGKVGCFGGARSDDSGEFVQRRRDPKMTVSGLDAELVVPTTQVLAEVTWAAEASETRVTSSGRAA